MYHNQGCYKLFPFKVIRSGTEWKTIRYNGNIVQMLSDPHYAVKWETQALQFR